MRPASAVLALAVDKLHQRRTLSQEYGLAVPAYAAAPDPAAVDDLRGRARLAGGAQGGQRRL